MTQEVEHPRINVPHERIAALLQATPLGDQPIQFRDVAFERFVAGVVPIDVKANRQWFRR